MELSAALLDAIDKYLAGESGPEEDLLVNAWYHAFDDREVEIPRDVQELRRKVARRIWHRLTRTIEGSEEESGTPAKKHFFIGRRQLMIAASLLLLLGAGGFLFLNRQHKSQTAATPALVQDIIPGGNRAMLTLANGSQIPLDSARNGVLARQGAIKILKLDNGKLLYDLSSQAGSAREPVGFNIISTPRGGQYQVTLPDGTAVWLNAASSLRYPTRFSGKNRTVQLTGEAYFEVAKNPRSPFIVDMADNSSSDTMHIEVLGTTFNVNGYEDEGTIKTTLVAGSVKLLHAGNSSLLLPGQQAQTESNGGFTINRHADLDEALAWKNGLFQFNSTNLQVIMRQIARWYDVQTITEGKANDESFSGSVPRAENVSQILHMLAMTNTVRFRIEGRTIRAQRIDEK